MQTLIDRNRNSCVLIVALILPILTVAAAAGAQDSAPGAALSPDAAFLIQAANSYGIVEHGKGEPTSKAWHLRVSFQLFGPEGSKVDSGTYEEISENMFVFKRIFRSQSFNQTQYPNRMANGDPQFPPAFFELLRTAIVHPMVDESRIQRIAAQSGSITSAHRWIGSTNLHCYDIELEKQPDGRHRTTYCFNDHGALVRYAIGDPPSGEATFMNPVKFRGREVPGGVVLKRAGIRFLVARLETIETLSHVSDALFQLPVDAQPLQPNPAFLSSMPPLSEPVLSISAGVAAGMLMHKADPIYPRKARAARVSGTVVLQATIGTDGGVEALQVISGPPMLRQAALNAVNGWRYRPYTLNGWPTPIETTVDVVFAAQK
jgi:TonB family protein